MASAVATLDEEADADTNVLSGLQRALGDLTVLLKQVWSSCMISVIRGLGISVALGSTGSGTSCAFVHL